MASQGGHGIPDGRIQFIPVIGMNDNDDPQSRIAQEFQKPAVDPGGQHDRQTGMQA